ncbi:MAG: 30S ribosomal protein S4 [Erysipelotrichaceae bacterium]
MARIKSPTWKISRRLGFSILETGQELNKRPYAPGQHGQGRRQKISNYGLQLREKQRIRHLYGVNEKQFFNTFKKASKMAGVTGHNFLFLLESRLDNIVYRMGFARTRRQARQLVNHSHILVNGKKVNIPSYRVSVGDEVSFREKSANLDIVNEAIEVTLNTKGFVKVDSKNKKGTYLRLPERNELNLEVNELLVVEYYNKLT